MNASSNAVSAKIYQFPVRSRAGPTMHEGAARIVPLRRAANVVAYCPEVSYHEAAIAEDRARKA